MVSIGHESETEPLVDDVPSRSPSTVPPEVEILSIDGSSQRHDENRYLTPHYGDTDNENVDFDDDEEGFDRENRFEGPSSTWRNFTEDERGLVASLDQQRADDLSIHLYNAYVLKARVREPESASKNQRCRSKKRRIKLNEDGTRPWYPDAAWTAWPLEAQNVPRREEQYGLPLNEFNEDAGTYRRTGTWNSTVDIEEEIQALILREAKDIHRKRDSEDSSELAFLAGDEQAITIFGPSVRDIISNLDDLLVGLCRQGRKPNQSRSHSRKSRSKSISKPRVAASKAKSQPRRPVNPSDDDYNYSTDSEASSQGNRTEHSDEVLSPVRESRNPKRRFNTKGWHEVMRVASLAGWSPAVIGRARRRCASLFGEEVDPELRGYRCPVAACNRHDDPYLETWRWREHLKRSHGYSKEQIQVLEDRVKSGDMQGPCSASADRKGAGEGGSNSESAVADDATVGGSKASQARQARRRKRAKTERVVDVDEEGTLF